jgi:hypothetical protein
MSIQPLPVKDGEPLKKVGIAIDPLTNKMKPVVEAGTHVKLKTNRRWYIPAALYGSEGWKSSFVRFAVIFGANVDEHGNISLGFIKWLISGILVIGLGLLIAFKFAPLVLFAWNTIGLFILATIVGIIAGIGILGLKQGHISVDGLAGSNTIVAIDEDEEDPEKRILVYPQERDFTDIITVPLLKYEEMDFFGGQESKTRWGDPVYTGDLLKGMAAFGSTSPEMSNHFIRKRFPTKDRVAGHHKYLITQLTKLSGKRKLTVEETKAFSDRLNMINKAYRWAEDEEYKLEEKFNLHPYYYKKRDRFTSAYIFQCERHSESVLQEMKTMRDNWSAHYREFMAGNNMMRVAKYSLLDQATTITKVGHENFMKGIGYAESINKSDPDSLPQLTASMYTELSEYIARSAESKRHVEEDDNGE